ncbi:MAG: methionine ABC transporter ATP-binding protein [Haloechinothrix sp.]
MITVENLTKSFHTATESIAAVRGVSLTIESGAFYGVFGPPGSGKSTLTGLIGLRDRPDTGAVRLDGVNPATLDGRRLREVRGQLGFLDSSCILRAERTAAGNIASPLEQLGVDGPQRRAKVAELLDLVGLTRGAAQHPAELNDGQRRRVALARALAVNPAVLLVDDLTAGLATEQSAGVLAALDRARGELGATVVLATAEADVVRKVCDNVAVLADGALLESGSVFDLLADQSSHTARRLLPAVDSGSVRLAGYDRVADIVLVGFAAVDGLLPEAGDRFQAEISTLDGGRTRVGETPIGRFRIGLRGERAESALGWLRERGVQVRPVEFAQAARVSRVGGLVARGERHLAGVAA